MGKKIKRCGLKKGEKSFVGLEQLFGSRTRFALLKTFCKNPEQKFFVRELARLIESQLNAVRRETANLKEIGILKEVPDEDAKKKFYKLDENFVLFNEISSLLTRSELLVERRLIKYMDSLGSIDLCALTGSLVGEEDCPCDILIIGKINKEKLAKLVAQFEKEVGRSILYTVFSPEEYKQRKALTDKFLFSLLEGKKVVAIDKYGEFSQNGNPSVS
ncbi:hypothetical protein ACFL29_01465 [Patescibacteria group bacterium]